MRTLFLVMLVGCTWGSVLLAQQTDCYSKLLQLGKTAYDKGAYSEAIKKWEAAKTCSDKPQNNELQALIDKAKQKISPTVSQKPAATPPKASSAVPFTPKMILIKGGTYEMGDVMGENWYACEKPVHTVTLSDFYISNYEVTFQEYDAFCNATNRYIPDDQGWGRGKRPVMDVSWYDAVEYCNWRTEKEGLKQVYSINDGSVTADWTANGYRLPTNAEWEFAAREGGKKVRFGNGKNIASSAEINYDPEVERPAFPFFLPGSARGKTLPVNSLRPNALGLYHMSGNVWEWCWDYGGDFDYSAEPQTNPKGPESGSRRVIRGGSWYQRPQFCRVAYRSFSEPNESYSEYGFRIARNP